MDSVDTPSLAERCQPTKLTLVLRYDIGSDALNSFVSEEDVHSGADVLRLGSLRHDGFTRQLVLQISLYLFSFSP